MDAHKLSMLAPLTPERNVAEDTEESCFPAFGTYHISGVDAPLALAS